MEKKEDVVETPKSKKTVSDKVFVQKVRLVSKDNRYTRMPYQFTVAKSTSSDKFVTGQENILTPDQMYGKESAKITNEQKRALQMGAYPHIIHPDNVYPCKHLRTFDNSYKMTGPDPEDKEYINPRDHAELTFFMQQTDLVAKNKAEYQKNKHYFYVEDKEKEAAEELQNIDLKWEAESFVRTKMSSDRFKDIILLMNFEVPGFNMDPKVMTIASIMSTVYKACAEHPNVILKLAAKDSAQLMFVLKLLYHKIIERKNNTDFYAGETYVGSTLEALKIWCAQSDHTQLVTKWGTLIESKERES